ncbi:MAG: HD domain-containing protein [Planctomycetes bacterium]|nr:HD domain-containing protein [Planctomycetota bacterium]
MCDVGYDQEALGGVEGFLDELLVALVNGRVYSETHPRLRDTLEGLVRRLEQQCTSGSTSSIEVGVVDGYLVHDTRPLMSATLSAQRLIEPVARLGAGGLVFERGATFDEFVGVVSLLNARKSEQGETWTNANTLLEKSGVRHIRLLPPLSLETAAKRTTGFGDSERVETELELPLEIYQGVINLLQSVSIAVCRGKSFKLDTVRGEIERIMKRIDVDPASMLEVARYEQYDAFTFGHSVRVCFLAVIFAKSLTPDIRLQERVGLAGLLHDIGKAKVPFEIVHAPGRLTDEEKLEMQLHTVHGARTLLDVDDADPVAVATAFSHHKTMDDRGYPKTGFWAPRSPMTKIVKICDVYEALTAVRPYKPAMSPVRAYRIMLSMRNHFDLALLRRFIETNGIHPVGTEVRLNTGELAEVVRQTEDLHCPIVILTKDAEGNELDVLDRTRFDLSSDARTERWIESDQESLVDAH